MKKHQCKEQKNVEVKVPAQAPPTVCPDYWAMLPPKHPRIMTQGGKRGGVVWILSRPGCWIVLSNDKKGRLIRHPDVPEDVWVAFCHDMAGYWAEEILALATSVVSANPKLVSDPKAARRLPRFRKNIETLRARFWFWILECTAHG